ncbi:MAG: alcohol dehydrogenase [Elusimicrobia bacterium RIFOXYA12_FULL_57_11]|nr:MAG: alcohol dehydrogenase [Elusimicrobia bacterium RIFOXYA12_FULL_57_11]
MKTEAAILIEAGAPPQVVELEIPVLKPGQALVEILYSGVCHTQLLECRGLRGADPFLPHCLGHEGSGIVRETGAGVTKVKTGDKVVLSWIKGSGADVPGSVYGWNGKKVNSGAIATFSRFSVISENRLTPVPDDVPMLEASLLGCAVATGLGTVINTLGARPGQSIAIFGAGGVGLCAVAGARLSGCFPIIAIDILKNKLEAAKQFGATHLIDASSCDPVNEIRSIVKTGLDMAVEATGIPVVISQALSCVRAQGGAAAVVGNVRYGEKAAIDPVQFNMGKSLLGTWGGASVPERDYPRYMRMMAAGKLNLASLISRSYKLGEISSALDDLESGAVLRPLIDMSLK